MQCLFVNRWLLQSRSGYQSNGRPGSFQSDVSGHISIWVSARLSAAAGMRQEAKCRCMEGVSCGVEFAFNMESVKGVLKDVHRISKILINGRPRSFPGAPPPSRSLDTDYFVAVVQCAASKMQSDHDAIRSISETLLVRL